MSAVLNRAMTEDELLKGVTDALTLHGWIWTHHRRSDKALLMGQPGFPDIFALRGTEALALELKTMRGIVSEDQFVWANAFDRAGIQWVVVRPANYDGLLDYLK